MSQRQQTTVPTRRKIVASLLAVALIALFATACTWQMRRALAGNALSWAYVIEWPVFIAYTVYFWWKDIHGESPGIASARREAKKASKAATTSSQEQHDAYNRYLSELHTWEQGQRSE